jgi:hypothetical protein
MSDADRVYYDIQLNNYDSTASQTVPVEFNERRANPFLNNPDSYNFTVVRFNLDTANLPVFRPSIQHNALSCNDTIYKVTVEQAVYVGGVQTGSTFATQRVTWVPQDESAVIPSAPADIVGGFQNNSTGYYDSFAYSHFTNLVNVAIRLAYTTSGGVNQTPCKLQFQPSSGGFLLYAPQGEWRTRQSVYAVDGTYYKLYFNNALYELYSGFPAWIKNKNTDYNYQLQVLSDLSTDVVDGNVVVQQEYSSYILWTPVTSIVFTAANFPIRPSIVNNPLIFENGVKLKNGVNSDTILQITDFAGATNYKAQINYTPTIYRWLDLVGTSPLTELSFQVWWKDRQGELNKMYLAPGASCTMKVLFSKKDLNY